MQFIGEHRIETKNIYHLFYLFNHEIAAADFLTHF